YTGATSSQQLVSDAKERWQNSLDAYQDAMRVQAGAVGNLDTTRTETDALVSSSQSAVGALQADQAGNQLVALQTRQLADLTAVIAAQSRAQSLAGARTSAHQEQAREQLSRFLGPTLSYPPHTMQMFHSGAWKLMEPKIIARAAAVALLAVAMLACTLELAWQGRILKSSTSAADDNMDLLANELSRCKAVGAEAAHDAACKAAWAQNRARFLPPSAPRQDRSIESLPS